MEAPRRTPFRVGGSTRVVGIVADPIRHVRTPHLFNQIASSQQIDAICVPIHIPPSGLAALLAGLADVINFAGLLVTIPHKEAVHALCSTLLGAAEQIGSVNVVRPGASTGCWEGANFDGLGFVSGLKMRGHSVAGKRVLLVGAGGAGKAIAHAVAAEGPSELVIANRDFDKAVRLAHATAKIASTGTIIRAGGADPWLYDVIVNATSLGLCDDDPLPVVARRLQSGALVCEAVMRTGDTPFLRAARQVGCETHGGDWMLRAQIVAMGNFLGFPFSSDVANSIDAL